MHTRRTTRSVCESLERFRAERRWRRQIGASRLLSEQVVMKSVRQHRTPRLPAARGRGVTDPLGFGTGGRGSTLCFSVLLTRPVGGRPGERTRRCAVSGRRRTVGREGVPRAHFQPGRRSGQHGGPRDVSVLMATARNPVPPQEHAGLLEASVAVAACDPRVLLTARLPRPSVGTCSGEDHTQCRKHPRGAGAGAGAGASSRARAADRGSPGEPHAPPSRGRPLLKNPEAVRPRGWCVLGSFLTCSVISSLFQSP